MDFKKILKLSGIFSIVLWIITEAYTTFFIKKWIILLFEVDSFTIFLLFYNLFWRSIWFPLVILLLTIIALKK